MSHTVTKVRRAASLFEDPRLSVGSHSAAAFTVLFDHSSLLHRILMTVYHVWSHLLNELFPLSFVTIHVFSVGDRIYPRRQSPASVVRTGTAVLNLWAY